MSSLSLHLPLQLCKSYVGFIYMNYGVKEEEKMTKVRFCIFYKLKWVPFSILLFKSSPINFSFGNVSLLGWRDGSAGQLLAVQA